MFNKTEIPSAAVNPKIDKKDEERKSRIARTVAATREEIVGAGNEITLKAGMISGKKKEMMRAVGEETKRDIEKGLKQRHEKAKKVRRLMDEVRKELGIEEQ